jgi:small subunit ribosomal protein S6
MPATAPIYDLILLISMNAADDERAKIVADVESAIASGAGMIERKDDWGRRPLTYRINHQADAEYHLLQFSGPTALLESLSHSLRINDSVLRFRIIKVLPGQPAPPDSAPPLMAAATATAAAVVAPSAPATASDEAAAAVATPHAGSEASENPSP